MLQLFPPESDITLLNTLYHKSKKQPDGKYSDDAIDIIYKDNATNQKYVETIMKPDYEYYTTKDGIFFDHNQLFAPMADVQKVKCRYKNILKDIAKRTGNEEFFNDNLRNGNFRANGQLHTHPSIFLSDMDINDHYRFRFSTLYKPSDLVNLTKSYFDIEADTINMKGDFPEMGECPVNAVTIIDGTSNKVYTLLLRNSDNPLISKFEDKVTNRYDEFKETLTHYVDKATGGWKNTHRLGLNNLDFQLFFYDDEVELINDLFVIINKTKPDFVLAWNMAFDVPYIIERLKKLGVDPASVMCHPDFPVKEAYYYVDERNKSDFAERGDYANISSYSVFLDQLIHFASRRKGQHKVASFKLDYIGKIMAGIRKLDYSHITNNIAEFPWKDYELFVIYNIIDTLVQKAVEVKTDDIGFVFGKASMNNTRYQKCHRNTIYLKNRGAVEFFRNELIMGNNANINPVRESYKGGMVADPLLNELNGLRINGIPVRLYDNVVDYDFKSLYPSINREFNIGPNTMIGKILVEHIVNTAENPFNDPDYDRGGAFLEDMISKNYLSFGNRWFDMPSYDELFDAIHEYFTNVKPSYKSLKLVNSMNQINPFNMVDNSKPVRAFEHTHEAIRPFTMYKAYPMDVKIERSHIS